MFSPGSIRCMLRFKGNAFTSIRRRFPQFALRLIIYVCVVWSTSRVTYAKEGMTEAEAKKEQYACGARAAFALLRLIGEDATYSTVCDHFTFSENFSSVEDVRNAIMAHGVQCVVLRLQLTDLSSLPVPFIAHVARFREGSLDKGHFLIVTDVDGTGVQTYDPVLNKTWHYPWRIFSDRWYGYVIAPTQATSSNSQLLANVVGIHFLLVFLVVTTLGRKMWSLLIKNSAQMRLFVTTFIMFAFGLSPPADAVAGELLRSNSNAGANAVALLGGICGVEIPPGRDGGADPIDSLKDIQSRLQAYGLTASVRLLGYNDLASRNRPCIVPLRFSDDEKTSFCIFVQASDSGVYFVEAGPLTARTVSIDDFRRYWTGYAVFANVSNFYYRDMLGWALLGCGVPLVGYALIIYTRKACRHNCLPVRVF